MWVPSGIAAIVRLVVLSAPVAVRNWTVTGSPTLSLLESATRSVVAFGWLPAAIALVGQPSGSRTTHAFGLFSTPFACPQR
jgi:hypothetical protein